MTIHELGYGTTTCVSLYLEPFYNEGMSPDQARKIIESFRDASGPMRPSMKLSCRPTGINYSWKFDLMTRDGNRIAMLVEDIGYALNVELAKIKLSDDARRRKS